jgi:hypothetical protein
MGGVEVKRRFIEEAIERAGLMPIFMLRAAGELDAVRVLLLKDDTDLLVLGAIADLVRSKENGDVVRVHPLADASVTWIRKTASELDLLRAVAMARITTEAGTKIGVDWSEHGLELAQVALGFGATDLTGPITKKSGTLISADDLKKVKGEGMVASSALKRKEIAALIRNAGRECVMTDEVDDELRGGATPSSAHLKAGDAAHV